MPIRDLYRQALPGSRRSTTSSISCRAIAMSPDFALVQHHIVAKVIFTGGAR